MAHLSKAIEDQHENEQDREDFDEDERKYTSNLLLRVISRCILTDCLIIGRLKVSASEVVAEAGTGLFVFSQPAFTAVLKHANDMNKSFQTVRSDHVVACFIT